LDIFVRYSLFLKRISWQAVSEISGGKLECAEGNSWAKNEERGVVLREESQNYINPALLTHR